MREATNGEDPGDERREGLEVRVGTESRQIVHVVGALDLATSDAVEAALRSALDAGAHVRLDLSEVTFLDSSGMRGVLRAYRLAQDRDAVFEVVPGPPAVQRVLHITGVDARLTFVDDGDASPDGGR